MDKSAVSNYLFATVRIFFCVLALCWAYVCNERSNANNKYLMVFVAFLFPEIYLSQAIVRKFILKDYQC